MSTMASVPISMAVLSLPSAVCRSPRRMAASSSAASCLRSDEVSRTGSSLDRSSAPSAPAGGLPAAWAGVWPWGVSPAAWAGPRSAAPTAARASIRNAAVWNGGLCRTFMVDLLRGTRGRTGRSPFSVLPASPPVRSLPGEEIPEESLALLRRDGDASAAHEILEVLDLRRGFAGGAVEPVLRRLDPFPAGNVGGEIDLFPLGMPARLPELDRKSTRLNSSHAHISYAV